MEDIIYNKTKEEWNQEYSIGDWDYLGTTLEKNRDAIIGMYCKHFKPEGRILDVGCGECILFDFLTPIQQQNYIGIDISDEAIRIGKSKRNVNGQAIDALQFDSSKKFDVIVFNEVLICIDFVKIFKKYEKLLNDDGLIIISMFKSPGDEAQRSESRIWEESKLLFTTQEGIELKGSLDDTQWTWNIEVMKKKFN